MFKKNSIQSGEPLHNEEIDEAQLKSKITTTLQLIITLLEKYLENEWNLKRYKHIPASFIVNFNLLQIIDGYLSFVNDEDLNCHLINIAYLIYFICLCVDSKEHMIPERESVQIFEKIFFLMELTINRQHCMNIGKLSHYAIKYWFLIHERLLPITHKDINRDPSLPQIQIVLMQILPICQFLEEYFKIDWNVDDIDVIREHCVQNFYRKINAYTLRLLYMYRDKTIGKSNISTYELLTKHMNYMLKSRKYYDIEAAIVVFQGLVYILYDIIDIAKTDPVESQITKRQVDFFMPTICLLKEVIENFDIKWTDCMESVCVVNTVLNFLLFATWPAKVRMPSKNSISPTVLFQLTIEALKLLKLSIAKYMSPNLALLVDRINDSSLGQLGPLLRSKLAEEHWEIRDHSLQVLITISELSHSNHK